VSEKRGTAGVMAAIGDDLAQAEMLLLATRVRTLAEGIRSLCGVLDAVQARVERLDRELESLDEWVTEAEGRLNRLEGRG